MNWIKRNIPNLFTLLNISIGVFAIDHLTNADPTETPIIHYLVLAAALCDFLDGLLARKLKVQSEFGLQLDSLSDLVTFGVLPTFIYAQFVPLSGSGLVLILVPVCSAIRLARFNIDNEQKTAFKGISTTAHGMFVAFLPIITFQKNSSIASYLSSNPEVFLYVAVFFSLLMVSPIKMIALKFDNFAFKTNWSKYLLVFLSIISVVVWRFEAAIYIMLFYVVLSVATNFSSELSKSDEH